MSFEELFLNVVSQENKTHVMVFSACVSLPICPTSNNFWLLSNFNISEQSSEKQVHLDNKESVQDTENQVLFFQLLMETLDSYVTYGFDLFLFQVGKGSF